MPRPDRPITARGRPTARRVRRVSSVGPRSVRRRPTDPGRRPGRLLKRSAAAGLLPQASQADRLEVAVEKTALRARRFGLAHSNLLDGIEDGIAPERRPAREYAIQEGTQAVNVGRRGDGRLFSRRLLGEGPCNSAFRGSGPFWVASACAPIRLARPKSATCPRPSSSIRIFEGFRSRCRTPR